MDISEEYAKKELLRVGQKVKKPRNLARGTKPEIGKYPLKQALDHACAGKNLQKLTIKKSDYVELVRLLIQYKADMPGASKALEDRFFPTRFELREFTDRLAEYGHFYMSTERLLGHFGLKIEEEE